jgi:hypothetical protein
MTTERWRDTDRGRLAAADQGAPPVDDAPASTAAPDGDEDVRAFLLDRILRNAFLIAVVVLLVIAWLS